MLSVSFYVHTENEDIFLVMLVSALLYDEGNLLLTSSEHETKTSINVKSFIPVRLIIIVYFSS